MDKVALIIGGTGGVGSAIVSLLSRNGMRVYATYYKNKENIEKTKQLENCQFIQCDIRKEADVNKVIEHIINNESKIDIVINTATSRLKLKPFEQLSHQEFFNDIEVILLGAINLFRSVVPLMKKNKCGTIINMLTATINNPTTRMSSYITSKSGLFGLTKSLSVELKPFNINIYGISPSFIETDLIKAFPKKLLEIEREKSLDKKFLQPKDIAELTLNIIQKPEKYLSGTNIIIKTRQDIVRLIEK